MLISLIRYLLMGGLCLSLSLDALALPEIVYRAAGKIDNPESLKRANGFYARGIDGSRPRQPPPNISLFDHAVGALTGTSNVSSGYISTTERRRFAFQFINLYLGNSGYIYHIRPTANFYDVNGTLGRYSPHPPETEFAALGRIHFSQIIGWEGINNGISGGFIHNPDYRDLLFTPVPATSGIEYSLAGFPRGHRAWSEEPWRSAMCSHSSISKRSVDACSADAVHDIGEAAFYQNYKKEISKRLTVYQIF